MSRSKYYMVVVFSLLSVLSAEHIFTQNITDWHLERQFPFGEEIYSRNIDVFEYSVPDSDIGGRITGAIVKIYVSRNSSVRRMLLEFESDRSYQVLFVLFENEYKYTIKDFTKYELGNFIGPNFYGNGVAQIEISGEFLLIFLRGTDDGRYIYRIGLNGLFLNNNVLYIRK